MHPSFHWWCGTMSNYDIREWSPDHEKMGKGVTLTEAEAEKLKELLQKSV